MTPQREFERIGREMGEKTTMVRCSIPEYIEGLEMIHDLTQEAIWAAKEDMKANAALHASMMAER